MRGTVMTNCKICKSEDISGFVEVEDISYKGKDLQVSIAYSVCNNCNREFVSKPQIIQNELALRAVKKTFDGLLSSEEIVRAREELSLTQEQAARVFGGGRNAFSKYERGEVSQSVAMDKLIRICLNHRDIFRELAREIKK
jgi:HTH-type transcriptional regulator/antitoxin MqsA